VGGAAARHDDGLMSRQAAMHSSRSHFSAGSSARAATVTRSVVMRRNLTGNSKRTRLVLDSNSREMDWSTIATKSMRAAISGAARKCEMGQHDVAPDAGFDQQCIHPRGRIAARRDGQMRERGELGRRHQLCS
jgi:hypothetical protein